ncbi:16S rRNA (cytosine(967)-C(5))-methyltransferase RsmB [Alicyclobacillus mengziensis]|uniref:16S rRNA (cytosine(967)-C(5))-methyltransferase n=1 Tax=Alicyclobacillus mengziensis TaxID=2931921 RepID=A0A9X7Z9C8_9BACL|nr:16S rRNA (cytosine(967)-C(5))-methyltransferase RsmB [Alicyclobacillus mengziensis]QSO49505.1 16S rRNA (cytosine(967)-C(5))-methyltransferase RsmB [Alicyclobacillus mengziensis]
MTAAARISAYEVLLEIEERGKYSNVALQQHYRSHNLHERDKALCTEIVYGTLQYQRSIDAVLEPLCKNGLAGVDTRVLVILRMSVYQLGYLSRVPGYAVLNDAVELCKAKAKKAAGFVNGVLRSFTRDKRSMAEKLDALIETGIPVATRMAIRYSYPDWFVEDLLLQYGDLRTVAILQAGNERPHIALRVNAAKSTPRALIEGQSGEMREALSLSSVSPFGVRLLSGLDVEHFEPYAEGLVSVQDEASMLVAPLLKVDEHTRVLDLCAGLGTKTTQILELQGGVGNVTAVDIHHHKLVRLKASAERLGLKGVKTMVADARSFRTNARHREAYDAVLLDAPCSGMGVLKRRPEIRWRKTREESQQLSRLQKELLRAALSAVRPGGVVVYATCTLLQRENEDVVDEIIREEGGSVTFENILPDLPETVRARCTTDTVRQGQRYSITVTPEQYGTDGFFMTRLRKLDNQVQKGGELK